MALERDSRDQTEILGIDKIMVNQSLDPLKLGTHFDEVGLS
jgi:hypothetical protein